MVATVSCYHRDTRISNTRPMPPGSKVIRRRRRVCNDCGTEFITLEVITRICNENLEDQIMERLKMERAE